MDVILDQIDAALKKKGYSDAKASKLAVGHPSLIKNFRMKREGEKRYNWAALERLADVLGLELYFGPPRDKTRPIYNVSLDGADYAAIPRIAARLAAGAGAVNEEVEHSDALAFRRDWLRARAISPDQAYLLTVTGDSMAPTLHDGDLVMIDRRRRDIRNHRVYALIDTDGTARVKRLDLIPKQLLILTSDNPAHPTETRQGDDMNLVNILGEIVWSAHSW